jgi:DNA-binding NtrC family response regulator
MLTILLVDHEPLQASLRKSALEKRFSDVRRVGDAAEALCLVEQPEFANTLRLVISGNHRPGISGPAFVTELLTRMPSLPVLVLGGEGDTAEAYSGPSVRFLPRPFGNEELLATASRLVVRYEVKSA